MAHSKAEKEAILGRFHASGLPAREACRLYPEFPSSATLGKWLKLEDTGALTPAVIKVHGRCEDRMKHQPYPTETKLEAVRLLRNGWDPRHIARRLNILRRETVITWGRNVEAKGVPTVRSYSDNLRKKALSLFEKGEHADDIANALGVSAHNVYTWARKAGISRKNCPEKRTKRKGGLVLDDNKKTARGESEEPGAWARAWGDLPEEPEERARMAEVRLAEALAVLDVLKVPGPNSLTNMEKHRAGQIARKMTDKAKLADVLDDFTIAKSTYLAQSTPKSTLGKYTALRARIRHEFDESKGRYGSESIWQALRKGEGACVSAAELVLGDTTTPVVVSEKVVRRIMAEEDMVPVQLRGTHRRYSSYAGETDERPSNLPLREDNTHDFHSDAPGKLIVTDVTEFKLPNFKIYLSPAIDCFDGMLVAWTISEHPDDDLTAGMLELTIPSLKPGAAVHSDGGANYRSGRWKALCIENSITRSMSRKAASPDNARAEGFFGTLKQEFFYARDWYGVSKKKFISLLEEYLVWYRDHKIKKALGWRTLKEYRAFLNEAA